MSWEPAQQVAKNAEGKFVALIGGQWEPVEQASKNAEGKFQVFRTGSQPAPVAAPARQPDEAEMMAGTPGARFAFGAASPFLGAVQLGAEAFGSKGVTEHLSRLEDMKKRGMSPAADLQRLKEGRAVLAAMPGYEAAVARIDKDIAALGENPSAEPSAAGFDAAGLAGTVMSPVGLYAASKIPLAANAVSRAKQGAVVGASFGAATPVTDTENFWSTKGEQVGYGAAIGSGANVILPPLVTAGVKAAGKVADVFRGRTGSVEAGAIAREAAGADLPAVKAALANAPDDITAAQATYGLNNDQLASLGALAEATDKTSFFSRLTARKRQELFDIIRKVAGGANQTEARKTAQAAQDSLNRLTTPMREDVLTQANIAGTTGTRLGEEAEALAQAATSNVADVRRLGKAGEIAEQVGARQPRLGTEAPPVSGLPRTGSQHSYGTELAKLADRIADQPAADSLLLGQGARFKQMQIKSLADDGLQPLSGESIIVQLRAKIADPHIGSETMKEKVLKNVLNRFEQWTKADGVIDAAAAYGIRKSAVNDAIEQLMGSADPASKAKAAAGVLRQVKPLIDDALSRASGNPAGWKAYLNTFEDGMKVVNQQKMGAKFLELLERNPKRVVELAKGNEPQVVEKRFGSEYDINAAMGEKMIPINRVASDLQRDIDLKAAGARGAGGLQSVLKEHERKFKLWNVLDPRVAMINRALGEVETKINKETFNKLMSAQRNPKAFLHLLNTMPTVHRQTVIESLARQGVPVAGGLIGGNQKDSK